MAVAGRRRTGGRTCSNSTSERGRKKGSGAEVRQLVETNGTIPHHHQRQSTEASSRSAASILDGGSDSRGGGQSSEKNLGRTNGGVPAAVVLTAAAAEAASTAAAWLARRSASERSVPASFCCLVRGQSLEEEATGLGKEGRKGGADDPLCCVDARAMERKGRGRVRYVGSPGLRPNGERLRGPV